MVLLGRKPQGGAVCGRTRESTVICPSPNFRACEVGAWVGLVLCEPSVSDVPEGPWAGKADPPQRWNECELGASVPPGVAGWPLSDGTQ